MPPLPPPFRQTSRLLVGWGLFLPGLIITPLPLPIGLIMVALGLSLLVAESRSVRTVVRTLRARWPRLDARLQGLAPHLPAFARGLLRRTRPRRLRRD